MKEGFFNTSSLGKIALGLILGLGIVSTSKILNDSYAFFNSTWPTLVGVIVASYFMIIAQAQTHANKFKQNVRVNHWLASGLRIIVSLATCSLFHVYHYELNKVLILVLFSLFYLGPVFSINLNEMRLLPVFYLGKDGKNQSIIDSVFNGFKYGGELLVLLQLVGMVGAGYLYLK